MNGIKTKKIVLTGPESSGKSDMASFLSRQHGFPLVEEQARSYLGRLGKAYSANDILSIARLQMEAIRVAELASPKALIIDTALLELKVWLSVRFGKSDPWLDKAFLNVTPDLYLLCRPDIPWEPDPLRESEGERDDLFAMYKATLEQYQKPFLVLEGRFEERKEKALKSLALCGIS